MSQIIVGNLKVTKQGIKCDRSSRLGNPFKLYGESSRYVVCDAYEDYLKLIIKLKFSPLIARNEVSKTRKVPISHVWRDSYREDFIQELNDLIQHIKHNESTTLLCWCAPKRCHCDVLKKLIDNKLNIKKIQLTPD